MSILSLTCYSGPSLFHVSFVGLHLAPAASTLRPFNHHHCHRLSTARLGGKQQQYAWNGSRIVAINQDLLNEGFTAAGEQAAVPLPELVLHLAWPLIVLTLAWQPGRLAACRRSSSNCARNLCTSRLVRLELKHVLVVVTPGMPSSVTHHDPLPHSFLACAASAAVLSTVPTWQQANQDCTQQRANSLCSRVSVVAACTSTHICVLATMHSDHQCKALA